MNWGIYSDHVRKSVNEERISVLADFIGAAAEARGASDGTVEEVADFSKEWLYRLAKDMKTKQISSHFSRVYAKFSPCGRSFIWKMAF